MPGPAHPHLPTMIPVNQQWAIGRRPHKWDMRCGPLWDDLVRRTTS